jgi:hypothetical protein
MKAPAPISLPPHRGFQLKERLMNVLQIHSDLNHLSHCTTTKQAAVAASELLFASFQHMLEFSVSTVGRQRHSDTQHDRVFENSELLAQVAKSDNSDCNQSAA